MEVINICLDIEYLEDRHNIIRRYLLPKLLTGYIKLDYVNYKLYSDIFNVLDVDAAKSLKSDIMKIVGDFIPEDFVDTEWKIDKCHNCDKVAPVSKCKSEHDEECAYAEMGEPEGCKNRFCDTCIFHICEHDNPNCKAVRCGSCFED